MKRTVNSLIFATLICCGCATTQRTFDVFSDVNASQESLMKAEQQLRSIQVTEAPSFWTRIVNDELYSEAHRRLCLIEYFQRHVTPGTSVSFFAQSGASNWFNATNFVLRLPGGKLPIKPINDGGPLFVFVPDLLRKEQSAIYLQISQKCDPDTVLKAIQGRTRQQLTIAQIGMSRSELSPTGRP
jgi:hypothetical protein